MKCGFSVFFKKFLKTTKTKVMERENDDHHFIGKEGHGPSIIGPSGSKSNDFNIFG